MKCPHCGREMQFAEVCPHCGKRISYGGNTVLYQAAKHGKLKYSQIFSNVFKKHTMESTQRSLSGAPAAGTDMLKTWEKPWLFSRLFVIMILMCALLFYQERHYSSDNMLSSLFSIEFMFMAALVGPLTVALLVWEMDIHRKVNLVNFLCLLFFGGLLGTALALPLNNAANQPAWFAGVTEEGTKLVISLGFILLFRRKGLHCLDGLAIGAAVGAGFAFWENIFYAFLKSGEDPFWVLAIQRSTWSMLGSHMLYTAPYIGALCYAINGSELKPKHFKDPFFLVMLAFGMGAHALNNSDNTFGLLGILRITDELLIPFYWIQVPLTILAYGLLLYMLRRGINQAMDINDLNVAVANAKETHAHNAATLICRSGTYAGSAFAVDAGKSLVIGRQPEECNLVLGGESVSRKHGMLRYDGGRLIFRDLGSSNGSRVNGKKVTPNEDILLNPGDTLDIGSSAERFEVA